jgi:hypothetical protein
MSMSARSSSSCPACERVDTATQRARVGQFSDRGTHDVLSSPRIDDRGKRLRECET